MSIFQALMFDLLICSNERYPKASRVEMFKHGNKGQKYVGKV